MEIDLVIHPKLINEIGKQKNSRIKPNCHASNKLKHCKCFVFSFCEALSGTSENIRKVMQKREYNPNF
jgi:hypothetical protein